MMAKDYRRAGVAVLAAGFGAVIATAVFTGSPDSARTARDFDWPRAEESLHQPASRDFDWPGALDRESAARDFDWPTGARGVPSSRLCGGACDEYRGLQEEVQKVRTNERPG